MTTRSAIKIVSLALIILLTGCGSSADPVGTDPAAPASTAASTAAPATTAADEELDGANAEPESASEAVAIAEQFMEARDSLDLDRTMVLLTPDAQLLDFGFWTRTPDEYEGLYEWMGILDWRWMTDRCWETKPGPPTQVTCLHTTENKWSRAQGTDPVRDEMHFWIEDGLIVQLNSDLGTWIRLVVQQWGDWLERQHPADVTTMYRFNERDELTGGPATTPEALALYREYVPEYVAELTESGGESNESGGESGSDDGSDG